MTDDEWEADEKAILNALYDSRESFSGGGEEVGLDETAILVDHVPEIVLGLGFRRSEVPEPSTEHPDHTKLGPSACPACDFDPIEPQGEPSDAQVEAALQEWWYGNHEDTWESKMRAALRAALTVGEVR